MARIITQETFNEQVKENQELFEVEFDQAIIETIEALKTQGVSLLHVIPEYVKYEKDKDPISLAIIDISSTDSLLRESGITSLNNELLKGFSYQFRAGNQGVTRLLFEMLSSNDSKLNLQLKCLELLTVLIENQPDLMKVEFLKIIIDLLKSKVSIDIFKLSSSQIELITKLFRVLELSCTKHEFNRSYLANSEVLLLSVDISINLGKENRDDEKLQDLIVAACKFLRIMTQDDDIRVEFGKGNEYANKVASDTKMIEEFSSIIMSNFNKKSNKLNYVSEMMEAIASILVREEYCLRFLKSDGVSVILSLIEEHSKNRSFLNSCLRLLHNLCRSDDCKKAFTTWRTSNDEKSSQIYPSTQLIIEVASDFIKEPIIVRNSCLVISHASLRQIDVAKSFVLSGAASFLSKALEIHINSSNIVRPICMAIRNCVARNPLLRLYFVPKEAITDPDFNYPDSNDPNTMNAAELLFEQNLNIVINDPESSDEAKAALRDLGCRVKFKELWAGSKQVIN